MSALKSQSPRFRRVRARRWIFGLFVAALLLVPGCKSLGPPKRAEAVGPLFFPPPPDPPRLQYLGSISSQRDLPHQRGKFADFILGPEPVVYRLLKPNNALLVEDRLYVCDTVLNTVLMMNLASGEIHPLAGDGGNGKIKQPNNITRDEQGNLYVADKIRQAVLVYGPDEQFSRALGRPGEAEPVDVAVGVNHLYVCDIKDHQIEVWDRQSGALVKTLGGLGSAPGQFNMPSHVTLDAKGNLFVTDTGNFRVQKLTPEGKSLRIYGGHGDTRGKFAWPKGIAVDGHGRLYTADSRFFNVQIFDDQGRLLLFFGGPGRNGGFIDLPAGVHVQPWPAQVPWVASRLAAGFDPEYLLMVVSQDGEGLINFFAVGREKTGTP